MRCSMPTPRPWIAAELLDSHIYLPIHFAYAERYSGIVQQVMSQPQCRVCFRLVPQMVESP